MHDVFSSGRMGHPLGGHVQSKVDSLPFFFKFFRMPQQTHFRGKNKHKMNQIGSKCPKLLVYSTGYGAERAIFEWSERWQPGASGTKGRQLFNIRPQPLKVLVR